MIHEKKEFPSPGRIVFYNGHLGVWPAIITKVISRTCLNLHVFSEENPGLRTTIKEGTATGEWFWPQRH